MISHGIPYFLSFQFIVIVCFFFFLENGESVALWPLFHDCVVFIYIENRLISSEPVDSFCVFVFTAIL